MTTKPPPRQGRTYIGFEWVLIIGFAMLLTAFIAHVLAIHNQLIPGGITY